MSKLTKLVNNPKLFFKDAVLKRTGVLLAFAKKLASTLTNSSDLFIEDSNMVKNVYSVQGSYGNFGLTTAMLRRCDEFIAHGINCVSLTLDFTPNIYEFVAKAKAIGKAPSGLECRNPYIDLSTQADYWLKNVGHHIASCFLLACLDDDTVVYYKTNGYKLNQKKHSEKDRHSFYEYQGKVINQVFLIDDVKVEYNYSPDGLCISIREFDRKTNKQLKFLVFDYSFGVVRNYESSYWWNVAWIKDILPSEVNTVLICDGPGTARKLQHIDYDNVKTLYVIHHNHKTDKGIVTKRDKWNLENKNKFDAVLALTEHQKKDLAKDYGNDKFYNILNFTKVKEIDSKIIFEPLQIGFIGQLTDRKGLSDAIKAIALLHRKYKLNAKLEIFGGTLNSKDFNKSISKYKELIKEKGIENFVTFHGYTSKVAEAMSSCNCILFPSYSEAQGLTIIESMHLGVPVIAYDCKYGPSSMIENGKTGYLCEVGDIEGLAKNANYLLTNIGLREEISKLAKIKSREFTDTEYIFQQWQNMFNELFSN